MTIALEPPIEVMAAAWTDEECARYAAELAARGRTVWDGPGMPSAPELESGGRSDPDTAFDEPFAVPTYHPVHDADITLEHRQAVADDVAVLNTAYRQYGTAGKPQGVDFDALPPQRQLRRKAA